MNVYRLLSKIFPARPLSQTPRRIVLILPCCIGDVVLATATLAALRRGYPDAHITWAVGRWSRPAIEGHPLLDALLDTGNAALPVRSPLQLLRFARQLRAGQFDLAVSLVRSPLMSLALLLSGIPDRVGLDSDGRGFGYSVRAPIDPNQPRHEAEVYLDAARALGLATRGCWANIPVSDANRTLVRDLLAAHGLKGPYLMMHPGGGRNPGMVMDSKRWPPEQFAALANRLAGRLRLNVVIIGGPGDQSLVAAVSSKLEPRSIAFAGELNFGQIAALAHDARVYIGNDTGMTHLAAAAGAKTVMILGPSDPIRYAPFTPEALALWKPTAVQAGGVAAGGPVGWDWARDGLTVDEAERKILEFLSS
jgi:ADP-heptose:LPS heptosyltransferase